MAEDIRLAVDFFEHPKTVFLIDTLGIPAGWSLIRLWCFCARYKPRGILDRMNPRAIEMAAKWHGEEGKFVQVLQDIGFLDCNGDNIFSLHDWEKWNSWSYHKEERSEVAKAAAEVRWSRHNAKRMRSACKSHTKRNATSNAPSPSPSPSPYPSPNPIPNPKEETTIVPRRNDISLDTAFDNLIFPVKGGTEKLWELPDTLFDEWTKLYEGMDIFHDLQKALAWVRADPVRQKTARGMPRFLLGWLTRSKDKGWMKPKGRSR